MNNPTAINLTALPERTQADVLDRRYFAKRPVYVKQAGSSYHYDVVIIPMLTVGSAEYGQAEAALLERGFSLVVGGNGRDVV